MYHFEIHTPEKKFKLSPTDITRDGYLNDQLHNHDWRRVHDAVDSYTKIIFDSIVPYQPQGTTVFLVCRSKANNY